MKEYKISEPVFNLCLTVFTDCTIEELVKKYNLPNGITSSVARARFIEQGSTNSIWIKEKDITVVAHELLHFLGCALEKRGIRFSYEEEKDETYCYLLAYYLGEVMKKIKLKYK